MNILLLTKFSITCLSFARSNTLARTLQRVSLHLASCSSSSSVSIQCNKLMILFILYHELYFVRQTNKNNASLHHLAAPARGPSLVAVLVGADYEQRSSLKDFVSFQEEKEIKVVDQAQQCDIILVLVLIEYLFTCLKLSLFWPF